MNKREFELRKQLLWVYLRHGGRCILCGQRVNPQQFATDRPILEPLGIDDLLRVRLMHPSCKAAEAGRTEQLVAA